MQGILTVYRGDDTSSFGNTFMSIDVPEEFRPLISKVRVDLANITKYYDSPTFPFEVSFTADETVNIRRPNIYPLLATIYDTEGKSKTFDTGIKVQVKDKKYIGYNAY